MDIAREILEKHLSKDLDIKSYLRTSPLTYQVVLDAMEEAINDTHCCETLKDKYTMPFDVWYDKNVVESKDGKYFVDGERLRFYELISKHKTECLLDL